MMGNVEPVIQEVIKLIKNIAIITFVSFLLVLSGQSSAQDQEIQCRAMIDRTTVPQNQEVNLDITLEWIGPASLYDVEEITQPSLTNLEIVGSGSKNQVKSVNGLPNTIKKYNYILRPKALGMAYVEPITLRYICHADSQATTLRTQRIEVKIIDPVFEDEGSFKAILISIVSGLILFSFVLLSVIWWQRKRKKELLRELEHTPELTPSEKILADLIKDIDLADPTDMDKKSDLLSHAVRKFLRDCRGIEASHLPTIDLEQEFNKKQFNKNESDLFISILATCDEVKFARKDLPINEFEVLYNNFEQFLRANNKTATNPIFELENK